MDLYPRWPIDRLEVSIAVVQSDLACAMEQICGPWLRNRRFSERRHRIGKKVGILRAGPHLESAGRELAKLKSADNSDFRRLTQEILGSKWLVDAIVELDEAASFARFATDERVVPALLPGTYTRWQEADKKVLRRIRELRAAAMQVPETDTKTDTKKNPKKNRLVTPPVVACVQKIKAAWRKTPEITRESVVKEYVDEHGGSVEGILRIIRDNGLLPKRSGHRADT
jgi:hypothetical protein